MRKQNLFISILFILLLMASGCEGKNVVEEELAEETNISENASQLPRMSNREALDILYNYLYNEQGQVVSATFSDKEEFWGYIIELESGAGSSIRYLHRTDDELFCIFEFRIKGGSNSYAVNRESGEVIPRRIIDDNDEAYIINSEYTKAIEGKRNEDAQYFCEMEFGIEFDQGIIGSQRLEEIESYFVDSIPELVEYKEYIERKSGGKASLCIEFGENWDVIDGFIYGSPMEPYLEQYCRVFVGEEWDDGHKVNWEWFYVRNDCKEILYCYLPNEGCIPLEEWRESPFYYDLSNGMVVRNVGYDILECHRELDKYKISDVVLENPEKGCYSDINTFMEKLDKYLNGNELVYDDITSGLENGTDFFDSTMDEIECSKEEGYSIIRYDLLRFEEVHGDEDVVEVPIVIYYAFPEKNGEIQYDTLLVYFYVNKEPGQDGCREIIDINIGESKLFNGITGIL